MDKIKQINSIYDITKTHVSKKEKSALNTSTKNAASTFEKKIKKTSAAELKKNISEKLKKLDVNSENYHKLSKRIFLESVILWEFGDDIINDPDFHQIIEKITSAINNNEKAFKDLATLVKQLSK